MELVEWFDPPELVQYYILPNRIYYFLGADVIDSEGEVEWYMLLWLLRQHWLLRFC